MKYQVRQFKNMAIGLKELEPYVKNGAHLHSGKPFGNFGGMRSREVLANWLICAAINVAEDRELTFSTDPIGGDGIIRDERTQQTFPTEHVMVPPQAAGSGKDTQTLILDAISQKITKGGAAYCSGKTLVVFVDAGAGQWFPNRVARALPDPLQFEAVWVVSLKGVEDGTYEYYVAHLDASGGDARTFLVRISKDFDAWDVADVQ